MGLYYLVIRGIINHYKDPFRTTSISWICSWLKCSDVAGGRLSERTGRRLHFFFLVGIRCVFVWLNMYICILCIFICLQIHYVFIFVCICKIFNYTLFCCTHVCFFSAIYTYIRISYILHGICTPSLFRICWKSLKSCSLTFSSMKIRTP